MGVFHVKGWGPKSSVCPSKPGKSNFFGRDIPGFCRDLPGAPEKFEKKRFTLFLTFWTPGPEGPGNLFSTPFPTLGPKGPRTPLGGWKGRNSSSRTGVESWFPLGAWVSRREVIELTLRNTPEMPLAPCDVPFDICNASLI